MKKSLPHILALILFAMVSCGKDSPQEPGTEKPVITFTAEEGGYRVKKGESVTLTAMVDNAKNPMYSWKLDGKIISTGLICEFAGEIAGEYSVLFRVDTPNGFAEKQVKVTVLDKLPPEIDMPASLLVYSGKENKMTANVLNADGAAYEWKLNGKVISTTETCTYTLTQLGTATLSLKVTNADGQAMKTFSLTVLPTAGPELWFDNGYYRTAANAAELRKMTVPLGKSLVLAPVVCYIENPSSFTWTVDGAAQGSTTEYFTFTPSAKGVYLITVTEQSTQAKAEVQVTCTEPEGTFFRPIETGDKYTATTAYAYAPAPGQFIDFATTPTAQQAIALTQAWLDKGSTGSYHHIGAYGGYWVVGFDHSVKNYMGKADFQVRGNAFSGWSEPGIVWVMADDNGNGLPDDTWYELKGSETGKPGTVQRYALTYYRPKDMGSDIPWVDNFGQTGAVARNGYHTQESYFPQFITDDYYTLTGTRLAGRGGGRTEWWGYADIADVNRPGVEDAGFRIEDAIHPDGSPANLTHIDFVKVHSAVSAMAGVFGEISTEACVPYDLNF
jgi:hypothetical protein